MRILIVTATAMEIAPLVEAFDPGGEAGPRSHSYGYAGHDIDVLTTGVGMVATAAWCSRVFSETQYELALNLGVCGAFDKTLAPGTVVHIVSDRIAELGAEDDETFLTAQDLRLLRDDEFPFEGGWLVNASPPANEILRRLPAVRGISVNTVHGNERSIAGVVARFDPQVETMEGAAFMYCCLIHGRLFAQVRAVSNPVEKRNRASWRLDDAIRDLTSAARRILDTV